MAPSRYTHAAIREDGGDFSIHPSEEEAEHWAEKIGGSVRPGPWGGEVTERERLIAAASWWSGWCTDHEQVLPELTMLGGLLVDVKHQLAMDRGRS